MPLPCVVSQIQNTPAKMWSALVFLGCVLATTAQVVRPGGCPKTVTQTTLDLQQYLGNWYEIYKFWAIFEVGQKCVGANYQMKNDSHIRVDNSGIRSGSKVEAIGDLYMPDTKHPANLKVKFASSAPYGDYWVLDTDYKKYTLIYSCGPFLGPLGHVEFAWILSRQRTLDQSIVDKLMTKAKAFGIDTGHFSKTDQTGC
ncbi:apolipoprotein D-like [Mytilus galloprovincialis]|uniref:apolipoprotein D-like n=1 Tax=Mytilus galloprovincialis TaxID=29158 RepID=UPI003F7B62FD